MALGLAGGYLAAAINDMVFMLFDLKAIGIVVGIIILYQNILIHFLKF